MEDEGTTKHSADVKTSVKALMTDYIVPALLALLGVLGTQVLGRLDALEEKAERNVVKDTVQDIRLEHLEKEQRNE